MGGADAGIDAPEAGNAHSASVLSPALLHSSAYLSDSLKVEDFAWPEIERPDVAFDHFDDGDEAFPEVDFSLLLSSDARDAQKLARDVVAASADWGFFRAVNHGVPLELVAEAERLAQGFFQLPSSRKMLAARTTDLPYGFSGSEALAKFKNWTETLQIIWGREMITKLAAKIWTCEHEMQHFVNVIDDYCVRMGKLANLIVELLFRGLDLEASSLNEDFGESSLSSLRLNYYPPCPKPDLTFGTQPHTDYGILTILHQDSVGGLQVLKGGRWITIRPQLGSLIVNIGDCLQVLSNCEYRGALHRAVVNSSAARHSMAFFYNPVEEAEIAPLQTLVDRNPPAKYKAFKWSEYRQQFHKAKAKKHSPIVFYET